MRRYIIKLALALGLSGIAAAPLMAVELHNDGALTVTLGLEGGAGAFFVDNPNFGVGRVDLETGENTGDTQNFEAYIEPALSFNYAPGNMFELYGSVSVVGTTTLGDGDAGGFTRGDSSDFDLEQAHVGLKFNLSQGETPWVLDVSGGRRDLQIGNGWLFYDGNFDAFSENAFWLAPRTAFRNAGVIDLSNGTFGLTGFHVEGDADNDRPEVNGADLRLNGDFGEFGILYANITESRDVVFARDGMEMVSARALGVPVPMIEGLTLSGEYTEQFGSGGGNNFDSHAFYGEASYSFASLPWAPTLSYRYAKFSGDSNPGDSSVTAFDPLFYGFTGWGTWFQGEIVGEYLLFNSNQRNHMIHLAATPNDKVGIGAIYYHFDLDKNNYFGTPVTSRDFADEINFYIDWTLNDNVYIGAVAAAAFPGSGAKQAFGDNKNIYAFQTFVVLNF